MDKKDESNTNKKETEPKFSRKKLLLSILLIVIALIAIVTIAALNYNHEPVLNNTKNTTFNTTNISNVNNSSDITPKEGYSLVHLGGLDFFAPDKYLGDYKKGDYIDAFKGGKDYEEFLKLPEGEMNERIFINSSQLTLVPYSDKSSLKIEIYYKKNFEGEDLGIFNKGFTKNRTIEDLNVNGNNVKLIKTKKGFGNQNRGPNETYIYFEINDKSILIEFTGVPIDKYLIESFFRLN